MISPDKREVTATVDICSGCSERFFVGHHRQLTAKCTRASCPLKDNSPDKEQKPPLPIEVILGAFAVDALQENFDYLKRWAGDVKIETYNGVPVVRLGFALSARTPIADLSAFMVTHDVDVDFCYPGNHGGPVDEWLVTLTNQSANRVEEFVGRTLDEAITYAVTKYVQQPAPKLSTDRKDWPKPTESK